MPRSLFTVNTLIACERACQINWLTVRLLREILTSASDRTSTVSAFLAVIPD